jgi:hypothetical protein
MKIRFKQWLHSQMGVVPVDPKTPLVLEAEIEREWVGLTPEQVRQCFFGIDTPPSSPPYWWEYKDTDYMVIYNIIEAKLKEKNNG